MKALHLMWLALAAAAVPAETLYVSEKLEVAVYGQPTLDGDRIAVLRSADAVDVVNREGEAAQVRLNDGTEGWVDVSYLTVELPLASQLESLTEENERLRATARANAGAGAQSKTLQSRNAQLETELATAQRDLEALRAKAASPATRPDDEIPVEVARPQNYASLFSVLWMIAGVAAALGLGFWWGYSTLERRVRRKYGGLKVY